VEEREVKDIEEKKELPVEEKREAPDELVPEEKSLDEKVKELEASLASERDKYIRLYAEFENYRKRVQKEKEELVRYSVEPVISDLLTVLDNLEMALEHASGVTDPTSLIEGVELTLREFKKVIGKYGVEEIHALGKPFDPNVHHAMSQIERSDVQNNTIVEEYRKGYLLKDRVLRPSLVAVSRNVETKPGIEGVEESETAQGESEDKALNDEGLEKENKNNREKEE